ncbi:hypothetical protein ES703_103832 [subsurface metagenome]
MSKGINVKISEKQVKKIAGYYELSGKIKRLEAGQLKIQEKMKDFGIDLPFFDPYSFCGDKEDREIISILFSSSGLTTTEIASRIEGRDRWFVLRRLKGIEQNALDDKDLNPPTESRKRSIFIHEGHSWVLNRDILM